MRIGDTNEGFPEGTYKIELKADFNTAAGGSGERIEMATDVTIRVRQ